MCSKHCPPIPAAMMPSHPALHCAPMIGTVTAEHWGLLQHLSACRRPAAAMACCDVRLRPDTWRAALQEPWIFETLAQIAPGVHSRLHLPHNITLGSKEVASLWLLCCQQAALDNLMDAACALFSAEVLSCPGGWTPLWRCMATLQVSHACNIVC